MNQLKNTALLIMDVQSGIVERLNENKGAYLEQLAKVTKSAHDLNLLVIYVVVGFRPRFPEVSDNNKSFSTIKESDNSAMIDPHPVIDPAKEDVVVVKRRVSAFSGSDLEVVLRAKHVNHLILCGVATSGVVLSTLREAADKDFQITVLSDLCFDFDEEVHKVLTEKVFPRQAEVMTSNEWVGSFDIK